MKKIFGSGFNLKSKPMLIGGAVVLALVLVFSALAIYTYAHEGIFPRVSAAGVKLGGMSRTEATMELERECAARYEGKELTIRLETIAERTVSASELKVSFPTESIVDAALKVGREGGLFARVGKVFATLVAGERLENTVTLDETALENIVSSLAEHDVEAIDALYEVEEKELVLHPKTDGKKLNREALKETIKERFDGQDYSDVDVAREPFESKALDIDAVYSEVHKEVSDARLEEKDGENVIVPHVVGVDFDLEAARIAYEKSPDEIIRIPLVITEPEVNTKSLEAHLFKDTLADVTTRFSPKKVERTANVRLAAKLINGKVLNPGEEFSYNTEVGPRTKARGFKEAAIYASGEVVDGIGGGICQVSSTLYMAAIKANMKITERRNHSFYVDYSPKGEDATVVYGSIDFRFVNTSPYPIKIVSTSKDNYIRIQLMGTETEKFTVKLTKKTLSTSPFEERIKNVTTLKSGERHIEQEGQEGLVMEVYRNVYNEEGKLISSKLENKSTYKPKPQIVHVGVAAETEGPATPVIGEGTDADAGEDVTPPTDETPPATGDTEVEATEAEIEEGEQVEDDVPDWLSPTDETPAE